MEAERVDALKAIIGEIELISAALDGHLQEIRGRADDQDSEDAAQRLEFAFAELRAARHELMQATEDVPVPA